jgi:hypothetical protein
MKKIIIMAMAWGLVAGLAFYGQAKPHIYKWVKDKQCSSDDLLRPSESTRVLAVTETKAFEWGHQVMTDDLFMSLAEYHKTRHQQDGETNPDTVLPEQIIRLEKVELADEDYRFILEVTLKTLNKQRTRVLVKASPVYRIRDAEAEDARDEDSNSGGNSVEVKIKGDRDSVVGMGPIFVVPMVGMLSEYNLTPLPDASDRAAKLVRSFLYLMDKRVAGVKPKPTPEVVEEQPAAAPVTEEKPAEALAVEKTNEGVEVDIKVKSKK